MNGLADVPTTFDVPTLRAENVTSQPLGEAARRPYPPGRRRAMRDVPTYLGRGVGGGRDVGRIARSARDVPTKKKR